MGLEDREWYRKEQQQRLRNTEYFSKQSEPKNWLRIVLFWIFVAFVLLKGAQYVERMQFRLPWLAKAEQVVSVAPPPISTVTPHQVELPQLLQQIQKQANRTESVRIDAPMVPMPAQQNQGSVTIYHCKAYSGGTFWSSAYCGTQQALLDRTASVPGGMSFEQQVKIAETQRAEAAALYNQQPTPAVQVSDRCVALKRERDVIESRYSNWQWQPLEVINPDQTRMRGLRAEQNRLGCPTQ